MQQPPVKIIAFAHWDVGQLQKEIELWLKDHPLILGHFIMQYQVAVLTQGQNQSRSTVEHSMVIFYDC